MIVQDKIITEVDILDVIKERESRINVKNYSIEEAYELLQDFTPKI